MAHSKSALKRWRQSLVRRDRNRSIKSKTRTTLTRALASISDDATTAEEAVREAVSALDKAAQQGIIHNEMNLGEDDPDRVLWKLFYETAFQVQFPGRVAYTGADGQAGPRP